MAMSQACMAGNSAVEMTERRSQRVVTPERFELPTTAFEAQCSNPLSYGATNPEIAR